MPWIQFILETTQDRAEICSETLMRAGSQAVTLEDAKDNPLFEPPPNTEPLWIATRVIGLFESHVDVANVKKFLKKELQEFEFSHLKVDPLEDKDWVNLTNRAEALCFGNHLWVIPSNEEKHFKETYNDSNQTYIVLDPGLAFGTGTHPTTALCLEWLAKNPPTGKLVLDYGCGSGILGIAALKLNASSVFAVDHDPQALFSTQSNARKNGIEEDKLKTFLPEEFMQLQDLKFDLILANILAEPLIELAPKFASWIKSGGILLLSGVLEKQLPLITKAYQPYFNDFETDSSDEWVRLKAKKNHAS